MTDSQCAGWDITFSAEHVTRETVLKFGESLFKKWTFQKERGKSGFEHYQFRGSLTVKKRKRELVKIMREGGIKIAEDSVSPTSKTTFVCDDESYVLKEDTRIEGPWSSKDIVVYIPKDMRATPTWRPMQAEIIEMMEKDPNRRTINCVVDPQGNNGKSFLAMWLFCHGKSHYIPFFTEAKELMRMCHGMIKSEWRNTFFIDLPRALSHKAECEIYGGIEQLKTGMIYEDRYEFKMMAIDCVHVFIFTNRMPNMKLVSPDRWNIIHLEDGLIVKEPNPGASAETASNSP